MQNVEINGLILLGGPKKIGATLKFKHWAS